VQRLFGVLFLGLALIVSGSSIGCGKKDTKKGGTTTPTGGTGGTTTTTTPEDPGKGGDKKKELTVTADPVTVKAGDKADVMVKITRKNVDDKVEITFSKLPEGVTVKDGSVEKNDGKFTLEAKADAKAVKDHKATVTAKGGGAEASSDFMITVTGAKGGNGGGDGEKKKKDDK
jgi:hypothetical protein